MIAATRSFPERHTGLVIAVPCAIFGLSPLFLSNLARFFTSAHDTASTAGAAEELDPGRWLYFLATLLGAVNLLGAVGLKVIPWEEEQDQAAGDGEAVPGGLERSLTRPPGYDTECAVSTASLGEVDGVPDERSALLPRPAEPAKAETQTLAELLRSPAFWLFGVVFLLATGPCEMVMACLGGVIEAVIGVHASASARGSASAGPARVPLLVLSALAGAPVDGQGLALRRLHVQVISIFNTLSRLVVGALSDYLANVPSAPDPAAAPKRWQLALGLSGARPRVSRLAFLLLACAALSAVFLLSAATLTTPAGLWALTITVGAAYGTAFTSAPAVIRSVWPASAFGRNWGLLSWFSALGAAVFTPLFGWLADKAASRQGGEVAVGREAFEGVFVLAGVSCAVAAGMVGVLWRGWWRNKV